MAPRRWLRNWRVKLGAFSVALFATFGFYSVIAAHPLTSTTNTGQAGDAATTTPVSSVRPAEPGSSTSSRTQPTAVPRQRMSRGS